MHRYSKVLILGLGYSGDYAARLLLKEGADVTVLDSNDNKNLRQRATALEALGAKVYIGSEKLPKVNAQACILSPGISLNSTWAKAIQTRGIPIIPELELGWSRINKSRVLAITGSNGKSTLTKLCAEAISRSGTSAVIAGNYEKTDHYINEKDESRDNQAYSIPVSQVAMESPSPDWLVLEVSSFQLETTIAFRPNIGVLLNLLPNHLDRHGNMINYVAAKMRMFAEMSEQDVAILPEDIIKNKDLTNLIPSAARIVSFGLSDKADFRYENQQIISGEKTLVSLAGTMFGNQINGIAAAAAAAVLSACGKPYSCLEEAAREFTPLPHRMRQICVIKGVSVIDDSKATNMAALSAALKMTNAPIRLIAGGKPKGDDYFSTLNLLSEKSVSAYLIGEAAEVMQKAWRETIPCFISKTLEQAAHQAFTDASPGDTILLSPGCSSFDQFRDFHERGNKFKQIFDLIKKLDS